MSRQGIEKYGTCRERKYCLPLFRIVSSEATLEQKETSPKIRESYMQVQNIFCYIPILFAGSRIISRDSHFSVISSDFRKKIFPSKQTSNLRVAGIPYSFIVLVRDTITE